MRFGREPTGHVFPAIIVMIVGVLCVWVSQSWASAPTVSEAKQRIRNTKDLLESQCNSLREAYRDTFLKTLSDKVTSSCDTELHGADPTAKPSCERKHVPFANSEYAVTAVLQGGDSCQRYQYKIRDSHDQEISFEKLVEGNIASDSETKDCASLNRGIAPEEFYNFCATPEDNSEDEKQVRSALAEIQHARQQMGGLGPITASDEHKVSGKSSKTTRPPSVQTNAAPLLQMADDAGKAPNVHLTR